MTPRIWDTTMFNDELNMLEMRLYELESIPNLTHVIVEANVDHQDHPKDFVLSKALEQTDRFDRWRDRLHVVKAKGLPPKTLDPDPWAREHGQREYVRFGLQELGAEPDDVVLHSDVDEIPTVLTVRNIRPDGFIAFAQRGHFWCVDWLYPQPWYGTVAAKWKNIDSFGAMRDMRNIAPKLPNGGWHFSWVDHDPMKKVGSFCHPEVHDRIVGGLKNGVFRRDGWHVDGLKMAPVDVDSSWPRWIAEGKCPAGWFRDRD